MHTHHVVYALPFESPSACFASSEQAEPHPPALTLHRLSQGARFPASDAPSSSVVMPADADLQNGFSYSEHLPTLNFGDTALLVAISWTCPFCVASAAVGSAWVRVGPDASISSSCWVRNVNRSRQYSWTLALWLFFR